MQFFANSVSGTCRPGEPGGSVPVTHLPLAQSRGGSATLLQVAGEAQTGPALAPLPSLGRPRVCLAPGRGSARCSRGGGGTPRRPASLPPGGGGGRRRHLLARVSPQAVPVELQTPRRGAENRPHDGGVRVPLLPLQPGRLPVHRSVRGAGGLAPRAPFRARLTPLCLTPSRHVLRAVLRHHHAQHQPAQPQRARQAHGRALCHHEPRHQRGRGPPRGAAAGEAPTPAPPRPPWQRQPLPAAPAPGPRAS